MRFREFMVAIARFWCVFTAIAWPIGWFASFRLILETTRFVFAVRHTLRGGGNELGLGFRFAIEKAAYVDVPQHVDCRAATIEEPVDG